MPRIALAYLTIAILSAAPAPAEEIRVAVASNFRYAMEDLAPRFERQTGHDVTLIYGSTGKHFAQISNRAPFDVFLAADELRPRMLEEDGLAVSGSRFVYAIGKLVLWSSEQGGVDGNEELLTGDFRFLAIANPILAPYGRAARQTLVKLGIWQAVYPQIVRGENVAQAYQYVVSGNADIGLIALSQIRIPESGYSGSHWEVPGDLHDPIRQQAALVSDTAATRAFASYLQSEEARELIRSYGYDTP